MSNAGSRELEIAPRHGEQGGGERRRLEAIQSPQPVVFVDCDHHRNRLAVFGHSLRRAPRALEQLAEAVLAVLDGPFAVRHCRGF